jgi:hypothetical protein
MRIAFLFSVASIHALARHHLVLIGQQVVKHGLNIREGFEQGGYELSRAADVS